MSHEIEPALTAGEWAQVKASPLPLHLTYDDAIGTDVAERIYCIALNNYALPDDHLAKITRGWVAALRELSAAIHAAHGAKMIGSVRIVGPAGTSHISTGDDFGAMADALESYLPPEGA